MFKLMLGRNLGSGEVQST